MSAERSSSEETGPADANGLIGSATARAPGVCGVLAQGVLGDMPFSVACPVDFYSRVRVDLRAGPPSVNAPQGCEKTVAAVRRTLMHLRRAKVQAEVRINNPIPRSRGLGSSSADLSAAIVATALALGVELAPYDIAQIALSVEPTGGVMMPGLALFDHRAGMVRQSIGPPPPMEIVALDFGGSSRVDLGGNSLPWRHVNDLTEEALSLIRKGVAEKDPALVGQAATVASEAAAHVSPRPRLEEVAEFAREVGAVGVNGGQNEGVTGVLLDATERRGKSTYIKAQQAFPEAEAVYHFRVLSGGVQTVSSSQS